MTGRTWESVGDALDEVVWGARRWLFRGLFLAGVIVGVAGTLLVQWWAS